MAAVTSGETRLYFRDSSKKQHTTPPAGPDRIAFDPQNLEK